MGAQAKPRPPLPTSPQPATNQIHPPSNSALEIAAFPLHTLSQNGCLKPGHLSPIARPAAPCSTHAAVPNYPAHLPEKLPSPSLPATPCPGPGPSPSSPHQYSPSPQPSVRTPSEEVISRKTHSKAPPSARPTPQKTHLKKVLTTRPKLRRTERPKAATPHLFSLPAASQLPRPPARSLPKQPDLLDLLVKRPTAVGNHLPPFLRRGQLPTLFLSLPFATGALSWTRAVRLTLPLQTKP